MYQVDMSILCGKDAALFNQSKSNAPVKAERSKEPTRRPRGLALAKLGKLNAVAN